MVATAFEYSIIAILVASGILIKTRPYMCFDEFGKMRSWGIGEDGRGKKKALFTFPIIISIVGIVTLYISSISTKPTLTV